MMKSYAPKTMAELPASLAALTPESKIVGGGTDFETPLSEAMQLMDEQGFENADIVFVTDGNCALSASFSEQLREAQTARRFTITGILLDSAAASDFSLQSFCGKIYRTSELCGDEIVRSLIRDRL